MHNALELMEAYKIKNHELKCVCVCLCVCDARLKWGSVTSATLDQNYENREVTLLMSL